MCGGEGVLSLAGVVVPMVGGECVSDEGDASGDVDAVSGNATVGRGSDESNGATLAPKSGAESE